MFYYKIDLKNEEFKLCKAESIEHLKKERDAIVPDKIHQTATEALKYFKSYFTRLINKYENQLDSYYDYINYIARYCEAYSPYYFLRIGSRKFMLIENQELITNLKYHEVIGIYYVKDKIIKISKKDGVVFLDFNFCPYNVHIISAINLSYINPEEKDIEFIIKILNDNSRTLYIEDVEHYEVVYNDKIYTIKELSKILKKDKCYKLNIVDSRLKINGCIYKRSLCKPEGCLMKDGRKGFCSYYKNEIFETKESAYVMLKHIGGSWVVKTNYFYVFSIYNE